MVRKKTNRNKKKVYVAFAADMSGAYLGIPFSAPNSTNHATTPNFKRDGTTFFSPAISPNYNVIKINKGNLIVYTENFLISDYHKA